MKYEYKIIEVIQEKVNSASEEELVESLEIITKQLDKLEGSKLLGDKND